MTKTNIKALFAAFSLTATLSLATAVQAAPLAIGAKLPVADATLKNAADGKNVVLGKVAGKNGTLVVFTCNTCPYAEAWEQRIVEIGNTAGDKGIGVVLVNANKTDNTAAMAKKAKAAGMKIPYAIDEKSVVAKAFGAERTPEAFLFDKDSKLVYHGTIDDNSDEPAKVSKTYLKDAVAAVAAGKAPSPAETKSLGCGIKFRN